MRSAIAVFGISIIYSSGCLASDGLTQMDDSELSRINGQALMNLSYTDPSQSNAQMKTQNIGFYKLGLDAIMDSEGSVVIQQFPQAGTKLFLGEIVHLIVN